MSEFVDDGDPCPICGKIMAKRGVVQTGPTFELLTHDGRPACSGHYVEQKHDGKLDEGGSISAELLIHRSNGQAREMVHLIEHHASGSISLFLLTPAQALSLLAWLEQEETELRRLADAQALRDANTKAGEM